VKIRMRLQPCLTIYITRFYRKSKIYVDSLSKEGQRIEEVSLELKEFKDGTSMHSFSNL
jgi:hypothetical protein